MWHFVRLNNAPAHANARGDHDERGRLSLAQLHTSAYTFAMLYDAVHITGAAGRLHARSIVVLTGLVGGEFPVAVCAHGIGPRRMNDVLACKTNGHARAAHGDDAAEVCRSTAHWLGLRFFRYCALLWWSVVDLIQITGIYMFADLMGDTHFI